LRGLPASFWWLWASTLVNRLGSFLVPFLAIYLTAVRGYSATHAGVVIALYGIGGAIGALIGGDLSDRIGRRPTMCGGTLLAAASTAAMGFATGSVMITGLSFVVGLTTAIPRPAFAAMVADIVPPADRTRAFAVNYWAMNLGFAFSAAIAGFLAHQGYVLLFLADAGTTLLCALLMVVKIPETRPERPAAAAPVPGARTGLRPLMANPRFLVLCVLGFALWALFFQSGSSLPIEMVGQGISTQYYGLVFALNGVVIVLLQIPVTTLLKARPRGLVLMAGALLTGLGFGLMSFAGRSALFYGLCVVIWTVGEICFAPAVSAAVAALSPVDARGRYQGVYTFSTQLALILGPPVGGLVLDHRGATTLWAACAVVGVATAAGFLALFGARREEPRRARPAEPPADVVTAETAG
jgi:predicted MFS family arabinose efflux permease